MMTFIGACIFAGYALILATLVFEVLRLTFRAWWNAWDTHDSYYLMMGFALTALSLLSIGVVAAMIWIPVQDLF